ncbi:hypothetical protein EVAR_43025_1 [Eumeta japonica]|uniref:Uncharacterized protein n=1 Tax=Eumeta variegata TaxID=151549 RepID=A0A4C1XP54_EUMVA|nr:hypothetical protein EVAR_43025_1 [Eumeta japonica]
MLGRRRNGREASNSRIAPIRIRHHLIDGGPIGSEHCSSIGSRIPGGLEGRNPRCKIEIIWRKPDRLQPCEPFSHRKKLIRHRHDGVTVAYHYRVADLSDINRSRTEALTGRSGSRARRSADVRVTRDQFK